MIVSTVTLTSFRIFKKNEFFFSPQTTIILGPNASGKTNLLEALFLLSSGRSFRDTVERDTIRFGSEMTRIAADIRREKESQILEMMITTGSVMNIKTPVKRFSVNGIGRRMVDFAGNLKTVLFWPQDMELILGSPTVRRKYLDHVLIQTDREYRRTLTSYERGLRQRNRVLEAIREQGAHRHQLIFWNTLLIKDGDYISKKRSEYIEFLNTFRFPEENSLRERFTVIYDQSAITEQRLAQYSEAELAAGVTLVGPHRDDLEFKIIDGSGIQKGEKERNLSHFGSRGEQRLAILWLKLAELAYVENRAGEKPVLLLDDIFSELDHEHRHIISRIIGRQQTIMTTTDEHYIEPSSFKKAELIKLIK